MKTFFTAMATMLVLAAVSSCIDKPAKRGIYKESSCGNPECACDAATDGSTCDCASQGWPYSKDGKCTCRVGG